MRSRPWLADGAFVGSVPAEETPSARSARPEDLRGTAVAWGSFGTRVDAAFGKAEARDGAVTVGGARRAVATP